MGKRNRKRREKKEVPRKTREQRETEINRAKVQLTMLNLGTEIPGIKEAFAIFDKYIEDGEYVMGKIKLVGCKRILRYQLVTQPTIECSIMLEFNSDV
tara:strand:+ start:276 stop:569 length:294 start_codon:yes stop_codon:yes gene_type:complete